MDDDLTVLVPARTTDVAIHGQLVRAGELVAASSEGLRYRFTPAGMRAVFDTGTTGPAFAQMLAKRARGRLPRAVSEAIERWWRGSACWDWFSRRSRSIRRGPSSSSASRGAAC